MGAKASVAKLAADGSAAERVGGGLASGAAFGLDVQVPQGLRERKRRATRAAIESAAIALVRERGYGGVTVAQICERAEVSQGTFFNYFPTKDAAIVGFGMLDLDKQQVHAAYDALMPSSMFQATLTLFLQVVRSVDWASDVSKQRLVLIKDTPELLLTFLDSMFEFVSSFRVHLVSYLEQHAEYRSCADVLSPTDEAYVVVAEAVEAAKFAVYRKIDNPAGGLPSAEEVGSVVRRIIV